MIIDLKTLMMNFLKFNFLDTYEASTSTSFILRNIQLNNQKMIDEELILDFIWVNLEYRYRLVEAWIYWIFWGESSPMLFFG